LAELRHHFEMFYVAQTFLICATQVVPHDLNPPDPWRDGANISATVAMRYIHTPHSRAERLLQRQGLPARLG